MGKKIYVGNLAYGVSSSDLQQMFEEFGTVQSAQVIMDRDTGRSKGFGFVEMNSDAEAQAAIDALNGKNVDGRNLTVNEPDLVPRENTVRTRFVSTAVTTFAIFFISRSATLLSMARKPASV